MNPQKLHFLLDASTYVTDPAVLLQLNEFCIRQGFTSNLWMAPKTVLTNSFQARYMESPVSLWCAGCGEVLYNISVVEAVLTGLGTENKVSKSNFILTEYGSPPVVGWVPCFSLLEPFLNGSTDSKYWISQKCVKKMNHSISLERYKQRVPVLLPYSVLLFNCDQLAPTRELKTYVNSVYDEIF